MSQFPPKSILCPLDLSSASTKVLRWAALFASLYKAKLQILHAEWAEYPRYFLPSQAEELSAAAVRARRTIGDELERLLTDNLSNETPREIGVLEGHPVERILEYAEQLRPDLIVMGSHGRSGFARLRLGSVAENVVQQTSLPTLIVRVTGDRPAPARITSILCPVTSYEHASHDVLVPAVLAATSGAHLILMHVEESKSFNAHTQQLCDLLPNNVKGQCEAIEVIRQGNAAEQILLVAREHHVDIIALTARHRRFLESTVIGGTTEKVMRHADSAVLVLPFVEEQHA